MEKTNAMRLVEQKNLPYTPHVCGSPAPLNALDVAGFLGQDTQRVFKTLVTEGKAGNYYVFMLPAPAQLDLKRAAQLVGGKSVKMLKSKELFPLTGYVHGGCSPLGMKKAFPTFIDISCRQWQTIFFSAGKIGWQIEMSPGDLFNILPIKETELSIKD